VSFNIPINWGRSSYSGVGTLNGQTNRSRGISPDEPLAVFVQPSPGIWHKLPVVLLDIMTQMVNSGKWNTAPLIQQGYRDI
jgi:hypothetical protein